MKQTKSISLILIGAVIGASLAGPTAGAVTEYFQAQRTPHPIYVDGKQVQLEAYAINGNNYVKLRDIGQAVGFEVYWDGSAAQVFSDKSYTGEAPVPEDYSQAANPAIFTGKLTRGVYNAIREALLHQDEVIVGTYHPRSMGPANEVDTAAIMRLTRKMSGGGTGYHVIDTIDGSAKYLSAEHDSAYDATIAHVRPFIESIAQLPQREQVRQMVWYIADRMTYNVKIKNLPSEILAQDEIMWDAGNCMTYSSSLKFLCEQAGIPCVIVTGDNHQWDAVYLDGAWWYVDPTAHKGNIETMLFIESVNGVETEVQKSEAERRDILQNTRDITTVLSPVTERFHCTDEDPETTRFLKELLVPGSTK